MAPEARDSLSLPCTEPRTQAENSEGKNGNDKTNTIVKKKPKQLPWPEASGS